MRVALLVFLLASVSPPLFAAAGQDEQGQSRREALRAERAATHAQRGSDEEADARPQDRRDVRQSRSWRPAPGNPGPPLGTSERDSPVIERDGNDHRTAGSVSAGPALRRRGPAADPLESVRNWRRDEGGQLRENRVVIRPGSRPSRVITPPSGARPDLQAPSPARVSRHRELRPWHREWRGDRRYDWRRHRDRNRWAFNLGFYYDPFGWNYRRYPIGWRMWPSYYQYDHWLHDPWRYRLPPAYGPYRWVRYWDDALLVDIHSGRVVDVIHDFFW